MLERWPTAMAKLSKKDTDELFVCFGRRSRATKRRDRSTKREKDQKIDGEKSLMAGNGQRSRSSLRLLRERKSGTRVSPSTTATADKRAGRRKVSSELDFNVLLHVYRGSLLPALWVSLGRMRRHHSVKQKQLLHKGGGDRRRQGKRSSEHATPGEARQGIADMLGGLRVNTSLPTLLARQEEPALNGTAKQSVTHPVRES
jgi:hypothetical protein